MEKSNRKNTLTFFQLLVTSLLAMIWTSSAAQVTGHVTVGKGEPAAAATVRIINQENTAVTQTVCNSKGYFSIDTKNIKEDTLTLLVTYTGCEPFAIKMGNMPAKADLGTIMMKSVTLQEVVVTPESRIVHPDRNVIFPDKNMVRASNNGYALLSHLFLPGISVDPHNKSVGAIGGARLTYI
ncbi:MAG: carboxypeptidase-like regulatory domain-containing protein [Prevotella sp.]